MFFFSSRRRNTRCALVTGVQTCALPIMYSTGFSPPISSRTSRKRSRRDERVARKQGIQMTTLLIAGATGLVGGLALKLALADERVDHVIALTRRPITPHAKQRNVVIDFADLPVQATWWSVDGVVSALGTTRAKTPSRSVYGAIDRDYPQIGRAHV